MDGASGREPKRWIKICLLYGIPAKVVTLCALSVTVTRDCETVTAEPFPRLWLADVS
jgi:hypothetical protein